MWVGTTRMPEAVLQLTEGERRAVPASVLAAAGLPMDELRERLDRFVRLRPSWEGGRVRAEAGRVVGSQTVGGLRVTVQPRLAAAEMAALIRYAWGRDVAQARTQTRVAREGLDELVGRLLADEAQGILQRGLARRYERRTEALPVLRGRPAFAENFPWRPEGMTRIVCTHHLLTADNLHNRLVRAALERAVFLDVSVPTRRALAAHRAAWRGVADAMAPTGGDFQRARERTDRLTEPYALALRLSELVLRGERPAGLFEAGESSAGFTLDMAALFEAFVERALREWAEPLGLTVRAQGPDRGAFLDGAGRPYRRVVPDLVVYRGGLPVAVVDAKYKMYWPAKAGGQPDRKVSTADLYQLFFYAQRLQVKHGLAEPPLAFLASPLPADEERGADIVGERYREVTWRAGGQQAGTVSLLWIPITRLVRCGAPTDRSLILERVFGSLEHGPGSGQPVRPPVA